MTTRLRLALPPAARADAGKPEAEQRQGRGFGHVGVNEE
jgi:hypothetical protein